MLRLLGPIAVFLFVSGLFAQAPGSYDLSNYGVRVEPDKRLMAVLATLEAAGTKNPDGSVSKLINTPLSPVGQRFREELARDNADLPDELRTRITTFLTQYKRVHPNSSDADLVSPFISMAYALSPAPELADPVVTSDLPGALLDVLDFAPLVREYYRKSSFASRSDSYVKAYKEASQLSLQPSTRDMVSELLNYLHTRPQLVFTEKLRVETQKAGSKEKVSNIQIKEHDRHFVVVPEALAPKGNITFLNIRDDYFLVVPPDTDVSGPEGRRAFLRFVIDPLIIANAKDMQPVRDWVKPQLEQLLKADSGVNTDPFLAVSRSLVAATDAREMEYLRGRIATERARQKLAGLKTDAEKRAVTADLEKQKGEFSDEAALALYEEYQKGAVLSFYFAEQLRGVEDSGFDIASSVKDMLLAFDPSKETGRLTATADARRRAAAARAARKGSPPPVSVENPVTVSLIEIQKAIDAKDLVRAQTDLKQLLAKYPSEPRIYYNIGRVAGLQAAAIQDPEEQAAKLVEARVAYTNAINSATESTDPILLSLTYVALGRIHEFYNDPETAMQFYDKAIKIGDLRNSGFGDAVAAKQRLLKARQ